MFTKLYNILKDSVLSIKGASQWELITKDLLQEAFPDHYGHRLEPTESCPKYREGQLVKIRYHHQWKHLHQEVGIITEVCEYDPVKSGPKVYFYEVLVGEQKITIIERFLDGTVETEEESTED